MKRLITAGAVLAALALPSAGYGLDLLKVSDHGTTCSVVNLGGGNFGVNCQGKLSGLGSQTTTITVTASFGCTNRGGNNPPGQVSGQSEPITPENGQVTFNVTTGGASCPDRMQPFFGPTATITVFQGGTLVFSEQVPITQ
jgi:hypothetical protein